MMDSRYKLKTGEEVEYFPPIQNTDNPYLTEAAMHADQANQLEGYGYLVDGIGAFTYLGTVAGTAADYDSVIVVDNLTTEDPKKALSALQGKILKGIIDDAVNFTNDDKLNARDYGAIGDGIEDDTQSIKDALLAAGNGSIKRVYLPAGNYMISDTLFISSDIELFGAGMGVTKIFLKDNSSLNLTLIIPVNDIGVADIHKWRSMISTKNAHYTNTEHTENIRVSDLEVDWGNNEGGVNSINSINFCRTKNSHIRRVKINTTLPLDLINTSENHFGQTIMFALAEDCSIEYSVIGSGDYEGVTIGMISKRTKITNNILISDKPDNYRTQIHQIQTARPSGLKDFLQEQFGEHRPWGTFINDNVFLMKRNSGHVATSHASDAFHFDNNIIKYYSTLGACVGTKPFSSTSQFSSDGNIFDLSEYNINPFTIFLLGVGTSAAGFDPIENGSIINNKIFLKSYIGMPTSGFPPLPLIGGIYSANRNVQILNNNVYIEGKTSQDKFIFGATGINIQVSNNNVFLQDQSTEIFLDDLSFLKTKGGSQITVSGNQVYGKIGKGVIVEDTNFGLSNLKIKDNTWNAIKEVTEDSINDAEIFLENPKEREGITKIQLNNIVGNKYNYINPLSVDSYLYKNTDAGSKAFVLVNAPVEPILLGASKMYDSDFQPDTDVVMSVEAISKDIVEYSFSLYNKEIDIWVTNVTETTAEINFRQEIQATYDVYINDVMHSTISNSGDVISGLIENSITKLKLKLTAQTQSFSKEISFKTIYDEFLSTWNTEAVGVSANDEIALPFISGGFYNFEVRYDGSVIKTINDYTDNIIKFTDGPGIKQINCIGIISGWKLGISGDELKINSVENFGPYFNASGSGFMNNAANLNSVASDLNSQDFVSGKYSFNNTGLINFPALDLSGVNDFSYFLSDTPNLVQLGLIDVSNGVDFTRFLKNSNIKDIPALDFSKGEEFRTAFYNLGVLTNFSPRRFDSLESGLTMFANTTIPTNDYSEILISIEANNINDNVEVHFGSSKYDSSAQAARGALINRGWNITDGGLI